MARKAKSQDAPAKKKPGRPPKSDRGPRTTPINFSAAEIQVIDRVRAMRQAKLEIKLDGETEINLSRADAIMGVIRDADAWMQETSGK